MSNHRKISLLALVALAASSGCKNDEAAIRVLQQVTLGLVDEVEERNDELVELEDQLMTCQANVAQANKLATVIRARDVTHDVPTLLGEPSIQSLEAYKAALDRTLAKQATDLERLRDKEQKCGEELAALTTRSIKRRSLAKRPAPASQEAPPKEAEQKENDNLGAAFEFDRSSRRLNFGANLK